MSVAEMVSTNVGIHDYFDLPLPEAWVSQSHWETAIFTR
jgi:hypothetical protein